MAVLKFRIYFEEDDAVYRDIMIKHTQYFKDLHFAILKAYDFDAKHQATFYRSNDNWQRGREISFEKYDKPYNVEPLLMDNTTIGNEIKDTNQRFVYLYDFVRNWTFLIELINVSKEESNKLSYPSVSRVEGIGPQQYGTRGMLGKKFVDIEEKYDLNKSEEGFGVEGGDDNSAPTDDSTEQEETGEEATDDF